MHAIPIQHGFIDRFEVRPYLDVPHTTRSLVRGKQGSHVREAASTFGHLTHFSGQCQPADLSLFREWCFTDMPSISSGTAHETKALELRSFGCSFNGALHKSTSVPRLYCATRSALGINDLHYDQFQRIDERHHGSAGIFAALTVPQSGSWLAARFGPLRTKAWGSHRTTSAPCGRSLINLNALDDQQRSPGSFGRIL